jgi:hypothetical protein
MFGGAERRVVHTSGIPVVTVPPRARSLLLVD